MNKSCVRTGVLLVTYKLTENSERREEGGPQGCKKKHACTRTHKVGMGGADFLLM